MLLNKMKVQDGRVVTKDANIEMMTEQETKALKERLNKELDIAIKNGNSAEVMRIKRDLEKAVAQAKTKDASKEYLEGYKAGKEDKPNTDNPYPMATVKGLSWMAGWKDGISGKPIQDSDYPDNYVNKKEVIEILERRIDTAKKQGNTEMLKHLLSELEAAKRMKDIDTKDGADEATKALTAKIGDIKKNMDAARKMGYDCEPYKKQLEKLTKDADSIEFNKLMS